MASFVRAWSLWSALSLAPTLAFAQAAGPSTATPDAPPPSATAAPNTTSAAAPSSSAQHPATGYGWSATKSSAPPSGGARGRRWTGAPRSAAPDAILPGFETLGDGSSRLFVQLTKSVAIEEKKAPDARAITYVLKGARVHLHNNTNALVTVHFNTPVSRARLVPHGGDVLFVVELRANVAPTWKMTPAKDGTAILQIDFPRGDYLSGDAPHSATPAPTATSPVGAASAAPVATPSPSKPR